MTRRTIFIPVVAALLGAIFLAGCTRMVRVETGERVTCTYGEIVSSSVKVIEVPADKAGSYKVVDKTVTCDKHARLETLYAEAQASILASDLAGARAKLAEIVAADAAFRRAKAQLDSIDAGSKPSADSGSGSGGGTSTDGKEPVGPIANLASLVPDTLPGYTAAPIVSDVFNLDREYIPAAGAPTDYLVVAVEQYRDAKSAKAAIARVIAPGYGQDVSTVQIGATSVRFGSDGKRFATVAWTQNGIMVAIEASSRSRKPADLKNHLISLAGEIVE
jgi:hypothetical protein